MRTAGSGTSVDGSRSEWEQWVVWQFAGGRAVRGEVFSLEDEPSARARFAELAAQTLTPYVDNRLLRSGERAQWLGRFSDESSRCSTVPTACSTTAARGERRES